MIAYSSGAGSSLSDKKRPTFYVFRLDNEQKEIHMNNGLCDAWIQALAPKPSEPLTFCVMIAPKGLGKFTF
jgi:hypothetical protein